MQFLGVENQGIEIAAKTLTEGGLVAFPTETVYGLGADAENQRAVEKIYEVKDRPKNHPLIVHIESLKDLEYWATEIPDYAFKLSKDFWPGPMTLILRKKKKIKDFLTGGQASIGLRIPAHPMALKLIHEFKNLGGNGLAAPSANKFGKVSPTTADAVAEQLLNSLDCFHDKIIDGGSSTIGIESTIISCLTESPEILRPGFITQKMIRESIGFEAKSILKSNMKVSGNLEKHYAPKAKVVIGTQATIGAGFIALADQMTPNGAVRLASPESLIEFARVLYSSFRLADLKGLSQIYIEIPSGEGLALAIRDRVTKAANS